MTATARLGLLSPSPCGEGGHGAALLMICLPPQPSGTLGHGTDFQLPLEFPRPPTGRLSEINVTPLVDVMLVLLIIFMSASAPLMDIGRVCRPTKDRCEAAEHR